MGCGIGESCLGGEGGLTMSGVTAKARKALFSLPASLPPFLPRILSASVCGLLSKEVGRGEGPRG